MISYQTLILVARKDISKNHTHPVKEMYKQKACNKVQQSCFSCFLSRPPLAF